MLTFLNYIFYCLCDFLSIRVTASNSCLPTICVFCHVLCKSSGINAATAGGLWGLEVRTTSCGHGIFIIKQIVSMYSIGLATSTTRTIQHLTGYDGDDGDHGEHYYDDQTGEWDIQRRHGIQLSW